MSMTRNSSVASTMIDANGPLPHCDCRTTGLLILQMRSRYKIPHYLLGGLVRYRPSELSAWAARSTAAQGRPVMLMVRRPNDPRLQRHPPAQPHPRTVTMPNAKRRAELLARLESVLTPCSRRAKEAPWQVPDRRRAGQSGDSLRRWCSTARRPDCGRIAPLATAATSSLIAAHLGIDVPTATFRVCSTRCRSARTLALHTSTQGQKGRAG